MEYAEHVDVVEAATEAFGEALARTPLDASVPSCPDWTFGDLARHVWDLTGFWAHVLCEGAGRPKTPFGEFTPDVVTGYGALATALVGELRAASPDTPAWSWAKDHQHAGFLARRIAHELTVHRYDAQLASGAPQPIAAEVAVDGIEEIFVLIDAFGPPSGTGDGETLHLHGTDRGDEWMIAMTPGGLSVDRSHAKADMALRGSVSDLELALYKRPPLGAVERFGDEAVLAAWYAAFTFE
ncbi:MAG: maleylpyruvate isomerase family mycothiol-dependent enzyme [Acidimicrobiales bacterium]